MDATQHSANALRNGGGQCGRTHTQVHQAHKQQVQDDVDQGGADQIVKRMAAVAHGVVDAHKDVVHHCEDGAAEIEAVIGDGVYHCSIGNAHPAEDNGCAGGTHNGQCCAGAEAEGDGGVDGLADRTIVFCAEVSGDHHAGAHGQAVEEADHQKDQTTGAGYCAHGVVVDKIADTPGVKGVIHLLEHLPQENREGKEQNGFPDGALGQGDFL